MNMHGFLSLVLSPVLIFQISFATSAANGAATGFTFSDVSRINSFKNTHHLFKVALTSKTIPARLVKAMSEQLNKKSIPLQNFKLMTDGAVLFQIQDRNHSLKRDSSGQYRLDGKLIDLKSKEWTSEVSWHGSPSLLGLPLFVEKTHAVEPLTVIVVAALIVILGGVVCSAPNIKISGGARTITLGDTAVERAISLAWTDAKSQVCRAGCNLACADSMDESFNPLTYLNKLCPEVAKKFPTIEDVERSSQEYERVYNPRQVRRTQLMAEVSRVNYELAQNLTLDVTAQEFIAALTSDPDLMKWCVSRTFRSTNGAAESPDVSGDRKPAIEQ